MEHPPHQQGGRMLIVCYVIVIVCYVIVIVGVFFEDRGSSVLSWKEPTACS